jgi:hypothetical protein
MPKETLSVVQATCDRCGSVGDTGDSRERSEWGEALVTYNGEVGSRSTMGDGSSQKVRGTVWLCLACTLDFQRFLNGTPLGA